MSRFIESKKKKNCNHRLEDYLLTFENGVGYFIGILFEF